MANQTVTTLVNNDAASVSGLLNGENYIINGGGVYVDADMRWAQQAAVVGDVSISPTIGGLLHLDATKVWEIAFDASTGNVPTLNALNSNGVTGGTSGATGELIRVWGATGWEPLASGGAMPASGWIKLRSKTGTFVDNETITLPGGATITVNSATGGKRSWVHFVSEFQGTVTVPRLGEWRITGDWYYLNDTNGADDQFIPLPVPEVLCGVQIETAPGSGVYEFWEASGLRWNTATQFVPTDARGKFFGQCFSRAGADTTSGSAVVNITNTSGFAVGAPVIMSAGFLNLDRLYVVAINPGVSVTLSEASNGTGTNRTITSYEQGITLARRASNACGFKPASGCKVRIPNAIVSNAATPFAGQMSVGTMNDRWETLTGAAGVIDWDHVWGPGMYLNASAAYSVNVEDACLGYALNISNTANDTTLRNVCVGIESNREASGVSISSCFTGATLENVTSTRYASSNSSQQALVVSDCENVTIDGGAYKIFGSTTAITRGNADIRSFSFARCFNVEINDATIIGGRAFFSQCSGVRMIGTKYADQINGTTVNTNSLVGAIEIRDTSANVYIEGFQNFAGIANVHPYATILVTSASSSNVEFRSLGTPSAPYDMGSANACGYIVTATVTLGLIMRRLYVNNTRLSPLTIVNTVKDVVCDNVWGDAADTQALSSVSITAKGCRWTNSVSGQNAVYGRHWEDAFTSTTAGRLLIACNEPLASTASQCAVTAGTPKFNSAGSVVMPTVGDRVVWEMPYFMLGVTSFANIAPTVTGTNPGNMSLEFQYDKGSGYNGTWLALTGANLSGAGAVTPATGVRLKVRATTTVANVSNALTYIRMDTVTNSTDQQIQYPLPLPPSVTVTSSEPNTLLQIFATGTQTVLASATSDTLAYVHSQETVDIVAQKAGFLPQRVTGVDLEGYQTQAFELTTDYNYDPSHGLSYTTDASWSRTNNQLTVPTWGPVVRSVYSLMIDAFIAQTSLRNTPFNLSMNGPTTLILFNGAECDTDTSAKNMRGGGVRYVSSAGDTTAEFVGVQSSGIVTGGQPEYEQEIGGTVYDARTTGNVDEIIKTYGDSTHGNFDWRGNLQFKCQTNGYRQAEFDIVAVYGPVEPVLYVIPLPMAAIDGLTLGDPGITGVTLTIHNTPVAWDAGDGVKNYSFTIEDSNNNPGGEILRWSNYFLSLDATFQTYDPFDIPELIIDNGPSLETLRGVFHDNPDRVIGGRVIRTGGTPHPDFSRFQADDGTYGTPPTSQTISAPNLLVGSRIRLYNVTRASEITNSVLASTGYTVTLTDGVEYDSGDQLVLLATYASGTTYKEVWRQSLIGSSGTATFTDAQINWAAPNALALDWTTVTECATDYVEVEVEVNDPDNNGFKSRLAIFVTGAITQADGIRNWVALDGTPVISWRDAANAEVDAALAAVTIINVKPSSKVKFMDDFAFSWSDGVDHVDAVLGSSIIWKNPMEVAAIETGTSGLTPQESDTLNLLSELTEDVGGTRFTAKALEEGVGGGGGATINPQDVRDAMKLAPSAGAAAAGSIDDKLNNINVNVDPQDIWGYDIKQSVAGSAGDKLNRVPVGFGILGQQGKTKFESDKEEKLIETVEKVAKDVEELKKKEVIPEKEIEIPDYSPAIIAKVEELGRSLRESVKNDVSNAVDIAVAAAIEKDEEQMAENEAKTVVSTLLAEAKSRDPETYAQEAEEAMREIVLQSIAEEIAKTIEGVNMKQKKK